MHKEVSAAEDAAWPGAVVEIYRINGGQKTNTLTAKYLDRGK